MKILTLSALSTLVLGLACTQTYAVDGTITVNGVVTDSTCTVAGGGTGGAGNKDIIVTLDTVPSSTLTTANKFASPKSFDLELKNAAGGSCGAATNKALKGVLLGTAVAGDYDSDDKTALVNKAAGASTTNPVFIQIVTDSDVAVDYSAAWGTQAKSPVVLNPADGTGTAKMTYKARYFTKSGTVDAQNVTATVNYTLQYN
ncbi:fimbrial protein [Acinetobacter sp.]|uniref:fimbrial protein n=1 Tax=Acinetobacter sp. TaxID=472 RepID=UPI002586EA69|nr:fimbrial protein [Acinetobacter sp.]